VRINGPICGNVLPAVNLLVERGLNGVATLNPLFHPNVKFFTKRETSPVRKAAALDIVAGT